MIRFSSTVSRISLLPYTSAIRGGQTYPGHKGDRWNVQPDIIQTWLLLRINTNVVAFSQSISSFPLPVVAAYPAGLLTNFHTLTEFADWPGGRGHDRLLKPLYTRRHLWTHPGMRGMADATFGGEESTNDNVKAKLTFKLLPCSYPQRGP